MHSFDYSSKNGYSFGGGSLWTPWPLDLLVVGGVKLLRPTRKPPGNSHGDGIQPVMYFHILLQMQTIRD